MNLEEAIHRHAEWKTKFRAAIAKQEKLDVGLISQDNCCEVGKWLHGAGRTQYGAQAEFANAVQKHRTFHVEAARVAQMINAGRYVEAESSMENQTPYGSASTDVGRAFISLKRAIAR